METAKASLGGFLIAFVGGAFVSGVIIFGVGNAKIQKLNGELQKSQKQAADSAADAHRLKLIVSDNEELVANSKQCWESLVQARAQLIQSMGAKISQDAELDSLRNQVQQVQYLPAPAQPQEVTAATILYEPQGRELAGIPLGHGLLRFQLATGPLISALLPQLGGMQPKWYVPGKVIPTFVGNTTGAQIFFFDFSTQQMEGPYAPQSVSARQ